MKKLLVFLAALSLSAAADDPKLASDLKDKTADAKVEVIVQFKAPPGQSQKDKLNQHGGQVKKTFSAIKSMLASMPAGPAGRTRRRPRGALHFPESPVALLPGQHHGCGGRAGGLELRAGRCGHRSGGGGQRRDQPPRF